MGGGRTDRRNREWARVHVCAVELPFKGYIENASYLIVARLGCAYQLNFQEKDNLSIGGEIAVPNKIPLLCGCYVH